MATIIEDNRTDAQKRDLEWPTRETKMQQVITWQNPAGQQINVSLSQQSAMERAGIWPRSHGGEFCSVYRGQHLGEPTYNDTVIAHACEHGCGTWIAPAAPEPAG